MFPSLSSLSCCTHKEVIQRGLSRNRESSRRWFYWELPGHVLTYDVVEAASNFNPLKSFRKTRTVPDTNGSSGGKVPTTVKAGATRLRSRTGGAVVSLWGTIDAKTLDEPIFRPRDLSRDHNVQYVTFHGIQYVVE